MAAIASRENEAIPGYADSAHYAHRVGAERKTRFKTVELFVAERYWEPPLPRVAPDQIVRLRVAFVEAGPRDRVKRAGGTWNPEQRIWQLRYDRAVALGLNSRIVDDMTSNGGCARADGLATRMPAHHPHRDARIYSKMPASRSTQRR
jgi:hypothetical protein